MNSISNNRLSTLLSLSSIDNSTTPLPPLILRFLCFSDSALRYDQYNNKLICYPSQSVSLLLDAPILTTHCLIMCTIRVGVNYYYFLSSTFSVWWVPLLWRIMILFFVCEPIFEFCFFFQFRIVMNFRSVVQHMRLCAYVSILFCLFVSTVVTVCIPKRCRSVRFVFLFSICVSCGLVIIMCRIMCLRLRRF